MLRYPYLREYVGRIAYDEAAEALDALAVQHAEQGEAVAKLVAQLRLLSKLYSKSNAVNKELVAEVDGNLREVIASLSRPTAVPVRSLTDQQKADRDALLYGCSFMLKGKHIPARDVTVVLAPKEPDAVAALPAKWRNEIEGAYLTGDPVIDARTETQIWMANKCADELGAALSMRGGA
ncbi:hypothetical protein C6N40_06380 [Arenimonas caeni]|uniref:Uncharacterized protein n=2 Tax=Arenimonas caeni TaxID=2058085 RepID=A0A2P6MA22_9GAMM|nr:hypothetical protein C6N40_06380 [Arenimonas caeni]